MWAVAGALLAAFVLLTVLGALAAPHAHVAAAIAGAAAAVLLAIVALDSAHRELAWALFTCDVIASSAIGTLAWRGLRGAPTASNAFTGGLTHLHGRHLPLGNDGVVVSALSPEGVVRVHGEQWSAISLNGPVPVGAHIQVVGSQGLKLEVWNEEAGAAGLPNSTWPEGREESQ